MRFSCVCFKAAITVPMVAALLAGCASRPPAPPAGVPEPAPPAQVIQPPPDAVPQVEPVREDGPNQPYEVAGVPYVPITVDRPFKQRGVASWYGRSFMAGARPMERSSTCTR